MHNLLKVVCTARQDPNFVTDDNQDYKAIPAVENSTVTSQSPNIP